MRTKAYIRLLQSGIAAGESPAEVGEAVVDEIRSRGKMTPEIYAHFLDAMADRGLYNVYTTPYNRNPPPIDGNFKYESKNVFYLIFKYFILAVYYTLGRVVARIGYGLRIKDRRNLRRVKGGVVTVANHFSYVDVLCTRCVTGWRPLKVVVAPHNAGGNWRIGKAFFRAAGAAPIATNLAGARNFNTFLDASLKKGKLVHFYAERAMWLNYRAVRPLLPGAFVLAAKNAAPVVPIFYAYRRQTQLRKLLHMHAPMTAYVLQPVYPDMSLAVKARADKLCRDTEASMKAAQDRHYTKSTV